MEEGARVFDALGVRLEKHDDNRRAVQEKLHELCNGLREQIDEIEGRINSELEGKFTEEDNRLQTALNDLRTSMAAEGVNAEKLAKAVRSAKSRLLVVQSYELVEHPLTEKVEISKMCELSVEKNLSLEWLTLSKPTDLKVVNIAYGKIALEFTSTIDGEPDLGEIDAPFVFVGRLCKRGEESGIERTLLKSAENGSSFDFFVSDLEPDTAYCVRVKAMYESEVSEWSDPAEFTSPGFSECLGWKECPEDVDQGKKYCINEMNPRLATKMYRGNEYCTIIGKRPLPSGRVTSWDALITGGWMNGASRIYMGVAPFDINQNDNENFERCGWYFFFNGSSLCSGPPHNYKWKRYLPKAENHVSVRLNGRYGVIMDTEKGELSFAFNCVNYGVAYEGIPLDKPLVPCVIIGGLNDSVELSDASASDNVDRKLPIPSGITVRSKSFDSLTFTWNPIRGASYQVEMDGTLQPVLLENTFSKADLFPETRHTFRVRSIFEDRVSEFSLPVKEWTSEGPSFSDCTWKECPDYAKTTRKYSLGLWNSRFATKSDDCYGSCTVIGNISIPLGKVTSWYIKLLRSKDWDGKSIFIGVAPSNIDQNAYLNYDRCGWYLHCGDLTLWSGPPHSCRDVLYKPGAGRKTFRKGDAFSVIMDTKKGDLSFTLFNEYLGVAYSGIPLDKPLVPCAILGNEDDSVEIEARKTNQDIFVF